MIGMVNGTFDDADKDGDHIKEDDSKGKKHFWSPSLSRVDHFL